MADHRDSKHQNGTARILRWEGEGRPLPTIPKGNYGKFLLESSAEHQKKTALVDSTTGKSYTYGAFRRMVLSIGNGLVTSGVKQNDAVLIISPNLIDLPAVYISTMLVGATSVAVNPMIKSAEIVHVIRTSKASWAMVHADLVDTVEEALASLPKGTIKMMWIVGDSRWKKGRPSLEDLKKYPPSYSIEAKIDPATTVALMPFSSGTTGLPKGVMLSHQNLMTMCGLFLNTINNSDLIEVTSSLLLLPVCHIYGYCIMNNALISGGELIFMAKFTARSFFETVQKYKVSMAPLTPHILNYLAGHPDMKNYDLSSLKAFLTGSAPISKSTIKKLTNHSGKQILQGYGLTETTGSICVNPDSTSESVGKVLPFCEAKVVDLETGHMLGERQEGELLIRSPMNMMGYANNPKATAEAIEPDGWLHTGDLCYYDETNSIFLTDRIKDMIKVKGYQVSPTELENIIRTYRGVMEVVVAGVPNERLGEAPKAWVVPVQGVTIDTEALKKYVAGQVSPYKQLSGGVEVVNSIPRNYMNKLLRRQLKKTPTASRSKL